MPGIRKKHEKCKKEILGSFLHFSVTKKIKKYHNPKRVIESKYMYLSCPSRVKRLFPF